MKINEDIEGYFARKSGLRQEDPSSSYLFVLSMEVLNSCINKAIVSNRFLYNWRDKETKISHFIFADDVLLFCKGDKDAIHNLYEGVNLFSRITSLTVNPLKYQCFFENVCSDVKKFTLTLTGFRCCSSYKISWSSTDNIKA